MPVVNVHITNNMHQFSYLQTAYLSQHMHQNRILHNIPVVCHKGILASLVQNGIKASVHNIKGHAVGTWIQIHFMQIAECIDIGHNTTAIRIIF
ncbi:hypothetical protein SDC9_154103 [bioreactor metagenome]|uniref:Uncharacterized protein n=1 Tax=bioreactor metagenome TaxID=1076179 RepID=A0A645EZI9_9ZZZZ